MSEAQSPIDDREWIESRIDDSCCALTDVLNCYARDLSGAESSKLIIERRP